MPPTSGAAVTGIGVNGDGHGELLGLTVGESETKYFWAEFIAFSKDRGLTGVRLVISDAMYGLAGHREPVAWC